MVEQDVSFFVDINLNLKHAIEPRARFELKHE